MVRCLQGAFSDCARTLTSQGARSVQGLGARRPCARRRRCGLQLRRRVRRDRQRRADASATATAPISAPTRVRARLTARRVGLTIDTIQSYDLVLPNGTITTVTAADSDLFFVLKGGFNTAGIVTSFTLSTQSFTQVWGGINLCVHTRGPV